MSNASSIRCLITAGPTREFLDPVRFLSNPSTGKMGFAIAEAAVAAGWTVDLVAGPVSLPEPDDVILYPVISAEEMFHQVDALFDVCDILIMTAAVSDFKPKVCHEQKQKKADASLVVEFERTVDILKIMAARKSSQLVVGFAAETNDVEAYATTKLEEKDLDWIVANRIGEVGEGFAADTNFVTVIGRNGERFSMGPDAKITIADKLVRHLAVELQERLF